MQLVTLERPAPCGPTRVRSANASVALAGVIGCIGQTDFGAKALAQLNSVMPLCWMSVYKLTPNRRPRMYASGAYGTRDGTNQAFSAYLRGLYTRDQTFLEAQERTRDGATALTHWHAHEIPLAHRRPIYDQNQLAERVSLVTGEPDGGVLAVNLYRSELQPSFDDTDIDLLCDWGAPLLATVQAHIRTVTATAPVASHSDEEFSTSADGRTTFLSKLPRREREVCERLLRGWTYDGIAEDLGLACGTVKTYRDRAFDRLELHHRNELFALALSEGIGKLPG